MQFLSNIMLDALKFFAFFGGYGWGIVWLTIAVNLALYPLTLSSVKSMSAMQTLQPKLKELQDKYKDKPQELQKATVEMYKSEGVNPFGGCLPVILKIPFFLALFWAFQSTAFLQIASDPNNNTSFLWISGRISESAFKSSALVGKLEDSKVIIVDEKASRKGERKFVWDAALEIDEKPLKDTFKGVSADKAEDKEKVQKALDKTVKGVTEEEAGKVIAAWDKTNSLAKPDRVNTPLGRISIFALLVGFTTYLMQKSMPSAGGGQMQQAQMMTMFMPVFLVFICWNFPVGVQLYWLMSNAVGAAQQYYISKRPKRHPKKKEEKK